MCNMMFGASLVSSIGDSPETATEEALLHDIQSIPTCSFEPSIAHNRRVPKGPGFLGPFALSWGCQKRVRRPAMVLRACPEECDPAGARIPYLQAHAGRLPAGE